MNQMTQAGNHINIQRLNNRAHI